MRLLCLSILWTSYKQINSEIFLHFFIPRYISGPIHVAVCRFNYILKQALTAQAMLFLNMIMLIRYIFIFQLKNPAGFRDDFWSYFLKLWVMLFSWISVITSESRCQFHQHFTSSFLLKKM